MIGEATLSVRPTLIIDGEPFGRIAYGSEPWPGWPAETSDPCHDCGRPKGSIHWHGCDMEACPRCGGQLISCPCSAEDPGGKVDRSAEQAENAARLGIVVVGKSMDLPEPMCDRCGRRTAGIIDQATLTAVCAPCLTPAETDRLAAGEPPFEDEQTRAWREDVDGRYWGGDAA